MRIICFIFAVHILNISIDPKDPEPDFAQEDLAINDIESIAEFFVEMVFGFENAFAEHDEPDTSNSTSADFYKVFFTTPHVTSYPDTAFITVHKEYFYYTERILSQRVRDITPPPPRV